MMAFAVLETKIQFWQFRYNVEKSVAEPTIFVRQLLRNPFQSSEINFQTNILLYYTCDAHVVSNVCGLLLFSSIKMSLGNRFLVQSKWIFYCDFIGEYIRYVRARNIPYFHRFPWLALAFNISWFVVKSIHRKSGCVCSMAMASLPHLSLPHNVCLSNNFRL